jgi:hypothetical protein
VTRESCPVVFVRFSCAASSCECIHSPYLHLEPGGSWCCTDCAPVSLRAVKHNTDSAAAVADRLLANLAGAAHLTAPSRSGLSCAPRGIDDDVANSRAVSEGASCVVVLTRLVFYGDCRKPTGPWMSPCRLLGLAPLCASACTHPTLPLRSLCSSSTRSTLGFPSEHEQVRSVRCVQGNALGRCWQLPAQHNSL